MKKIALALFCMVSMVILHAGDVATFVNLGFSADGTRFVFGQYGILDSEFRPYADVFCVDAVKNDYVPGGRFTARPAAADKDARGVFAALQNDSASFLKKIGVDSALQGRALYVQAENGIRPASLSFRDFETGTEYEVSINILAEGSLAAVKSSFYIVVAIKTADGKTVRKTIGLPGFRREGVRNYLVRRIITDSTGRTLVFVVEKELYEPKGSSVRFMVETLRLQ